MQINKVLYVVSTLRRTGPTSQLLYIVSNLSSEFEPIVVTLSAEEAESRLDDFIAAGIRVIQLNLTRLEGFLFARKRLANIIDNEKPVVIHSQGVRGDQLAASFSRQLPTVCTVRNFPQLDFPMTYGKIRGGLMAVMHTNALKKVSRVCGVSEAVSANLISNYNLKNVGTVRNGVDQAKYSRVSLEDKLTLRAQLGLPKDAVLFVSTGHLSLRKDPLMLIKAFTLAFSENKDVHLLFVGGGELLADCKKVAEGSNIIFSGRTSTVEKYLQAADFYVSASLAEGMPNAVLEALACGLPVILSDISPHLELLGLGYDIGFSFETSNAESCAQQMQAVICNTTVSFSDNISQLVEKELTANSMAKRYMKIYKGLTSNGF